MKCQYCGAEVTNRMGYCLQCGTKQEKQPEKQVRTVENTVAVPLAEQREETFFEEPAPRYPQEEVPVQQWGTFEDGEDDLGYCEDVPALMLPTGRRLWKMILFGILTLGIYPTVIWSRMVTELNVAASRHDGKRTMPYFGMLLLIPVTLGVYGFVWMHKFCARIGAELRRRNLGMAFGSRDFWLWNVLGLLILGGPFVFTHRLTKAMNQINADYNSHG